MFELSAEEIKRIEPTREMLLTMPLSKIWQWQRDQIEEVTYEVSYDGTYRCKLEPRGRMGLEGYQQGERYKTVQKGDLIYFWIGENPMSGHNYWEPCKLKNVGQFFDDWYPDKGTIIFSNKELPKIRENR